MSAKEINTTEVQTTTHYWGYRELSAEEVNCVGGGWDFGDMGEGWGDVGVASSDTQVAGVISDFFEGLARNVTHIMNQLNPPPPSPPPGQIPSGVVRADASGYFGDGTYGGSDWSDRSDAA